MKKTELRSRITELETQLQDQQVAQVRDAALRPFMDGKGAHDYQEMLYLIQESHAFKYAGFTDEVKLQGLIEALGDLNAAIYVAEATDKVREALEAIL